MKFSLSRIVAVNVTTGENNSVVIVNESTRLRAFKSLVLPFEFIMTILTTLNAPGVFTPELSPA
jgi:hypothetical protein